MRSEELIMDDDKTMEWILYTNRIQERRYIWRGMNAVTADISAVHHTRDARSARDHGKNRRWRKPMRHKKLFCKFGWHIYIPSNAEVKYIQGVICRITMRCECCGKTEQGLIRVPLPKGIKKKYLPPVEEQNG